MSEVGGIDGLVAHAQQWLRDDPDPVTRAETAELLEGVRRGDATAITALRDAFGGRLEFGTAGLRAALGAGPRRMNRVVIAQSSAGLAAYLHERAARGETDSTPSVVIGYDSRTNSDVFARDAAEIMAGSGIAVTLLPGPLPTPVTAFAVRHLHASAGVMITASHNPPNDNGYKVFLGDADGGRQICSPTDHQINERIVEAAGRRLDDLPRSTDYLNATTHAPHAQDLITAYVERTAASVRCGINRVAPAPIVYTAMHGVGAELTKRVFAAAGLPPLVAVAEQDQPDGSFPTVEYPNPEEPESLERAFDLARRVGAGLIIAHDPDADRLAVAAPQPDAEGGYRMLAGNELGLLLGWRMAERERRRATEEGRAPRGALANTIVSSPVLGAIARDYGLNHSETLSGFKWVSRTPELVFAFEESLGYLTNPEVVGDKDGISAAAEAVAMSLELAEQGRTLWDLLDEASERFGHFSSRQIMVRLRSATEVDALSQLLRAHPPTSLGGVRVAGMRDWMRPAPSDPPANMLAFTLDDGSRVMVRPSGTEPKLKLYIDTYCGEGSAAERRSAAERAIAPIEADLREFISAALQTLQGGEAA